MRLSEETIVADLIRLLRGMTDWEYPGGISRETRLFADLGQQSMQTVAFLGAIQRYYRKRIPFDAFLGELDRRKQRDIRLGDLVDFIGCHLNRATP